MLAEQQLDFALVSSHQGCLKSAPGAGSPLRQCRPKFQNRLDDLGIAAIERHSQQIVAILAAGFRVKIGRGPFYDETAAGAAQKQLAPASAAPASGAVQSIPTTVPSHPGAGAEEAASEDQDLHKITSPIVGTFYRAPSPTADSFVRIGSHVEPTSVVCIIEAMKLMNEIQAEASGEVVKIYVENGQAVEYGQPLFGIKQS